MEEMDGSELIPFQECIGYSFREVRKLKRALFHSSLKGEGIEHSNERLEFLGDAILGFCVADELFHRYEDADEKDMTRKHHAITCGENLARIGREIEMEKVLNVGGSVRGKDVPDSIIEDAVEALIGAIYDDGGFKEARLFIDRIFFNDRRLARALSNGDPITELKELCDRTKIPCIYREEKKTVNGKTLFFVYLQWQGRGAVGMWKIKKEAERRASVTLLQLITVFGDSNRSFKSKFYEVKKKSERDFGT